MQLDDQSPHPRIHSVGFRELLGLGFRIAQIAYSEPEYVPLEGL